MAGTISVVGFIGGMELSIPVLPVNLNTLTIVGNNTGSTANLADAVRAVAATGIDLVIDRTFSFQDAGDGYQFLERAAHFGKAVIDLDV